MEAKKTQFRVRKPLSDCTNTITKSSQSSSSTFSSSILKLKSPKPILSSGIIQLLKNDSSHYLSRPNPPDHSETSRASSVGIHLAASDPSLRLNPSSASELHRHFEPQLSRRHTTLKRKITGKNVGASLRCCPASTVPHDGGIMKKRGPSGRSKRQLSSDVGSKKNSEEEFIEQQRVYFAEIDAFELLEEEVGSDEDLG